MRERHPIIQVARICLAAFGLAMQCGPRVASAATIAVDALRPPIGQGHLLRVDVTGVGSRVCDGGGSAPQAAP